MMQSFLLKPLVAILAFVFGVIGVLYLAPLPSMRPVAYTPPPGRPVGIDLAMPFEKLMANLEEYDGKFVKFRAKPVVLNSGEIFFLDKVSGKTLGVKCAPRFAVCDAVRRKKGSFLIVRGKLDLSGLTGPLKVLEILTIDLADLEYPKAGISEKNLPPPITVRDLALDPFKYDGQLVRLRTRAFNFHQERIRLYDRYTGDVFTLRADCDEGSKECAFLSRATVDFEGGAWFIVTGRFEVRAPETGEPFMHIIKIE